MFITPVMHVPALQPYKTISKIFIPVVALSQEAAFMKPLWKSISFCHVHAICANRNPNPITKPMYNVSFPLLGTWGSPRRETL